MDHSREDRRRAVPGLQTFSSEIWVPSKRLRQLELGKSMRDPSKRPRQLNSQKPM
ncbi:unnamed protein product [Polarella glacialis]|uniref:Uncharacterized protein n=1 Tax=Polarella glacialis TaxID=89957 RepID=A0A813GFH6_POLGL|nr:unnamed protein product [Polarella glacialis]